VRTSSRLRYALRRLQEVLVGHQNTHQGSSSSTVGISESMTDSNSGPICCRLWTKLHRIKSLYAAAIVGFQRRFVIVDILFHSGDIRDQSLTLSEI